MNNEHRRASCRPGCSAQRGRRPGCATLIPAGPGRSAVRRTGVGAGKNHFFSGELIDIWGLIVAATHKARARPAHVVDEDKNDVGMLASETNL